MHSSSVISYNNESKNSEMSHGIWEGVSVCLWAIGKHISKLFCNTFVNNKFVWHDNELRAICAHANDVILLYLDRCLIMLVSWSTSSRLKKKINPGSFFLMPEPPWNIHSKNHFLQFSYDCSNYSMYWHSILFLERVMVKFGGCLHKG